MLRNEKDFPSNGSPCAHAGRTLKGFAELKICFLDVLKNDESFSKLRSPFTALAQNLFSQSDNSMFNVV